MIRRTLRFAVIWATISVLLVCAAYFTGLLTPVEHRLFDLRARLFNHGLPVSDDVIFVEFDAESLDALAPMVGGWPWPRGTVVAALMVDYIMAGNPAVLLFDELYATYSPKSPGVDIPEEDWLLLEASMAYPNVSHAVLFEHRGLDEPVPMFEAAIANFEIDVGIVGAPAGYPDYDSYRAPYEPLRDYASLLHAANRPIDSDGRSRRIALLVQYEGVFYPGLALRAVDAFYLPRSYSLDDRELVLQTEDGVSRRIPLQAGGEYLINPYPDFDAITRYSAADIVESSRRYFADDGEPEVSTGEFAEKIVVLGTPDVRPDIVGISNILSAHHLHTIPQWLTAVLAAVLTAAIVAATAFIKPRMLAMVLGGVMVLGVPLASVLLFQARGIVVSTAPLLVGSLVGYGGSVGFRLRTAAPAGNPIAGEMTFLVASTQDLSAQAEIVSPAHAGTALLTYIDTVRSSVEAHGGTVASVSGETVTAVFTQANGRAVDAALAVTERVAAGTRSVDSSPIRTVAAVHTGPGIVAPRSEFGRMVLGDGVSRATRICRLAVYYGVDVLVSAVDEDRGLVFLDAVTFGDRPDVVRVYVPLRSAGDEAAEFSQARAQYEQRSFAQAKERFSAIQATVGHPLAAAATRFAARCDRFLASPPPPQWNGVWRVGDQTYMSTRRPT
mgnify:CR=1 FL=1